MTVKPSRFRRLRRCNLASLLLLSSPFLALAHPALAQSPTTHSISGTILLDSVIADGGDTRQSIDFELLPTGGGMILLRTVTLDAQGNYTLGNVPAGTYTLSAKGSKWLRCAPQTVDITASDLTLPEIDLPGGDANNDNVVDSADFNLLINAFGNTYDPTDPTNTVSGYDPRADFDCDGTINTADFNAMSNNIGMNGAADPISALNPPPPIIPGIWVISTTPNGECSAMATLLDGSTVTFPPVPWVTSPFVAEVGGGGGTEHYESIGDVTVTCSWLASYFPGTFYYQLATPPPKLYLLETSLSSSFGNVPGQVDDGANDPPVTDGFSTQSSGSHLTQHDSTSGSVTFTRHLSGVLDDTGYEEKYMGVYVSYDVTQDDRSLSLSRDGARGETVDSDGNTHGDTIYSYHTYNELIGLSGTDNINWQYFHPIYGGSWHYHADSNATYGYDLDVTPSWSPSESRDDIHNGYWSMPHGNMNQEENILTDTPFVWVGVPSPAMPGTIAYTATDNEDGASATAKYVLTMHEPLEEISHHIDSDKIMNREIPPGGDWVKNNNAVAAPSPPETITATYTWMATATVTIASSASFWEMASVGGSIGGSFSYAYAVGNAPFVLTAVPPGYYTVMVVETHGMRHYGQANSWDTGGFVGIQDFDFTIPYPNPVLIMLDPQPTPQLPLLN